MEAQKRWLTEDKLALIIGMFLFCLAAFNFVGKDLLGWGVKTNIWTWAKLSTIFSTASAGYHISGAVSLILTWVFLTAILTVGIKYLGGKPWQFIKGFTVIFFLSYGFFALGSHAIIAANRTKADWAKYGLHWSMGLTLEAGFIIAMVAGLVIGNFFPRLANWLKESLRPEMYVKIAVIILGAELGLKALDHPGLSSSVIFLGFCAIINAYLIYWAVVYYIARKWFGFSREWSAPLASGISICGVSAAIATGGAIKARPFVPVMVSSLVIIFTCVEMLILPFVAQATLAHSPLVAGAWMGLVVKSDGGAIASGAITDALIHANGLAVMVATTEKVFIDIFIGIWAFVLAWIWTSKIDSKPGERMKMGEVLDRFPRFVLGYVLTFVVMLLVCFHHPAMIAAGKSLIAGTNVFRMIFFILTFFTIGVASNFRKLWEVGIGKLALVYVVGLFGFIIWVGLFLSWLFFHGVKLS
ncbi:MAG: YeiH family protein [Acidobacteriaceae bacterium]|nr:YeiH family protein [Acidobacteriaceae bacterium]